MDEFTASATTTTIQTSHWGLCYHSGCYPDAAPTPASFSPESPELKAQPVAQGGRQAAWYIQLPRHQAGVLRHYRRGGLIARFLHDQYFWCGAQRTRSWAEYKVMTYLYGQGVAVPLPVAAFWQRQGGYYRAALITERITGARPLAQGLSAEWIQPVARAIKQMHDAGIDHADLNVFNILLDAQDKVWLIDFDRARQFAMLSFARRQRNLARLQRSINKEFGPAGQRWYEQLAQTYRQWMLSA